MNTTAKLTQRSLSRILMKSSSLSFAVNIGGIGLALLMQVLLARQLGAVSYGYYSFVTTVVTFLVFPAKLGFDTAIVRFVSSYRAHERWSEVKGLLQRANQITMALSLAITAVSMVVVLLISDSMNRELLFTYMAGLLGIPVMALALLRQSSLQALKQMLHAQLPEKIIRPVLFLGLLLGYNRIAGSPAGAGEAMLIFLAAIAVSYAIGALVLKRKMPPQVQAAGTAYNTREWMNVSMSLMFVSGMYLVLGQLNILMLGWMDGTTEAGIYSAAVRIATLVSFGLTAINMTAAPFISECYARKDDRQLQQVLSISNLAGFLFAGVIYAAFLLLNDPILGLFGEEFKQGSLALLILSTSQLVSAFSGQTGTLMTMTGQQQTLGKILLISAILNVVLNLVMIPAYGMVGAAVTNLICTIVWKTAMVVVIQRKLKISIGMFAWLSARRKRGDRT
ncbi:flippase [Paenibacillus lutrae]|uniref:Oligosaccharide flippase family protein n=1 Tax=Paenibacillus lutrae TaxID=2078573 RepID=A0A7X3FJ25_9BACL|nr:flippase [Paenibacillus lutrae]MVP00492.1 oligosaccharide flippase family protein [Paenibacillus lutrae]